MNQFKVDVIRLPSVVSIETLANYLSTCSSVVRGKAPKDNIKLFMRLSEESYGDKPSRLFEYIPCVLNEKPDFAQTFGYMYKGEYWTNLRELLMNNVTMDEALELVNFSHQMTLKCVAPYFVVAQCQTHQQITSVMHSKRYTDSSLGYWIPNKIIEHFSGSIDSIWWNSLVSRLNPQELRDYMKYTIGIKRLEVYGRGADSLQLREVTLGSSLANPNGWKHFVNQRGELSTQKETRDFSKMIFDVMKDKHQYFHC